MSVYPKYAYSFMELISSNEILLNKYTINNIIKVRPFDVTLRDGIQSLTNEEQVIFTTDNKKFLYNFIIQKYNPKNLEIGSCVNNKILPIFNDTKELFNYVENNHNKNKGHYVLIPNHDKLYDAIKFGVKHFSFITSVSDSFQIKNTKKSISENYSNLNNMMVYLDDLLIEKYKVKLYVSCINECPIEGKIDIQKIVDELFTLSLLKFDNICLSDTCGSLTHRDFVDIIENTKKVGIDIKKFSLHLHVKQEREDEVEKIFH
jgi:hydroxymethylglutaryl-CoA lyase